jgi:hypothetical protein
MTLAPLEPGMLFLNEFPAGQLCQLNWTLMDVIPLSPGLQLTCSLASQVLNRSWSIDARVGRNYSI